MLTAENTSLPQQWIGRDGVALDNQENVSHLNQTLKAIRAQCQEAFSEAIHMGCSEEFLRIVLHEMVNSLKRNANSGQKAS